MSRGSRWYWSTLIGFGWMLSGTAHAGPVEILNGVSIDGSNAKNMVVPYAYGGGGLFVSQDGGETLSWLCAAGVAASAENRNAVTHSSGDGHIYVGLYDKLLRGGADGCSFQPVPELEGKYISTITGDPFDAKRTYVATSNGMVENGIFMNDGSGTFVQLGPTAPLFIDSLHVVKNGTARRFFETAVVTNLMTNTVTYKLRVSDDDAKTWTEEVIDPLTIDPEDKSQPDVTIVAIDPNNSDRVVANLRRSSEADTLIMSTQRGRAGSWKTIWKPTELGGVAFTPDGKMYFGDSDTKTYGLYVLDNDDAQAKVLNNCIRISCLGYDDANQRLLGCGNDYLFGTIDPATGVLKPMLDLRCAEHAVTCADKPEITELCRPPNVEYCKLEHWLLAPMCTGYDRGVDFCTFAKSQSFQCAAGFAVSLEPAETTSNECAAMINTGDPSALGEDLVAKLCGAQPMAAAGTSGGAGSRGGAAGTSSGAAGVAGSMGIAQPMTSPKASAGGCSCSSGVSHSSHAWSMWLAAIGGIVLLRRLRSLTRKSLARAANSCSVEILPAPDGVCAKGDEPCGRLSHPDHDRKLQQ